MAVSYTHLDVYKRQVLPLFHVSGLSILMRSLYNGTAMTIMESYDEEQVLQYIHDGRINMMSLVRCV